MSDLSSARQFLTTNDLAGLLGVANNTLRRWRSEGCGPRHVKLSRRAIRYSREAVSEWLAENGQLKAA
jgi:excisionase family DNA binding protein